MKAKELIGKRFERLTVLEVYSEKQRSYAVCKCDCGKDVTIRCDSITSGEAKSCGCFSRYQASDLQGQKFGRLTAIESTGTDSTGHKIWKCRCDCGKLAYCSSVNLKSGSTQSCGCIATAKALENVKKASSASVTDFGSHKAIYYDKPLTTNKLGIKNIHYDAKRERYVVQFDYCKNHYTIGRYSTLEEAVRVRDIFSEARKSQTFVELYNDYKVNKILKE